MKRGLNLLTVFILATVILLSGCSTSTSSTSSAVPTDAERIVGRWTTADGNSELLFADNGIVAGGTNGRYEAMSYSVVEGWCLIFSDNYGNTEIWDYELDDTTLTVLTPQGSSITYYTHTRE